MPKRYENYPLWIVLISNILSLSIYAIGTYILLNFGQILATFYLIYIILLEIRLIRGHCPNCYYYGKTCAFGKGRISSRFFNKGNQKKFVKKEITFKDMLPDMGVSLFPMVAAAVLLITDFSWTILILVLTLIIMSFAGNALIRSSCACKYCKQADKGCPALKLFSKK